jgi:hypothetical protein
MYGEKTKRAILEQVQQLMLAHADTTCSGKSSDNSIQKRLGGHRTLNLQAAAVFSLLYISNSELLLMWKR